MKRTIYILVPLVLTLVSSDLIDSNVGPTSFSYTMSLNSDRSWIPDFSDYLHEQEDSLQLQSGYRPLPEPLDTTNTAMYLAGSNLSEDLFMYLKRRIEGLQPDTPYQLSFEVTFATEAPSDCADTLAAPGDSAIVKAGGYPAEPLPVLQSRSDKLYYRMNIDKGAHLNGGENALVLGTIGNSRSCDQERQYELKTVASDSTVIARTNREGSLWIFVGSDSILNIRTGLYFTRIQVEAAQM